MLEHSFYNGIRTFSVIEYFFFVINNTLGNVLYFCQVSFLYFLIQFCKQFLVQFRKIVDKIERVLDFVSDPGC